MNSQAIAQGIEFDYAEHVAQCLPFDHRFGRKEPHLDRQSCPMKGCPGCGRKLLPTLATLEEVPLRERVYGSIATVWANNPFRPTGFNEAIPAGEGVRECGFHTSLRQLQEHHQIVEMFRQMWRKAALPIIGARVTDHSASKLRALVHPAIAQNGLRILLKGRGQGQNFSWGRRDNLKVRTLFRNLFQKGGPLHRVEDTASGI